MKNLFKKSLLVLMVAFIAVFTLSVTSKVNAADVEIVFGLGADGSASHADGSSATTYSETVDGYTLDITSGTKMYTGAMDAKGNSCIKLGTSSAVGSFTFTVPEKVTSVVIFAGKYKSNTTKLNVNGTAYTLTKNSNDGAYDEITVDTSSTKTVSFTTVSGGVRCMINTIKFYKAEEVIDPSEHECDLCTICNKCVTKGCPSGDECPTHSLSIEGGKYTEVEGFIDLTAALNNLTGEVVWSSSNPEVASVDQAGSVTALSMGTTTITATLGDFNATQLFTVYPIDGSTLTVAEAIQVCELTGDNPSPFKYKTQGTVSNVSYNESYSNYTYDLTDETGTIKVFGSKGDCELQNGYIVIVNGNLINYEGNTPEFNTNTTFERVIDESLDKFLENLNSIKSYMSLAYKYSVIEGDGSTTKNTAYTLSFENTNTRTLYSTEQQIWEANGIKLTNNKSSSTTDVGNYSNPARLYKNSEIIIEFPDNCVTLNIVSDGTTKYKTALEDSLDDEEISYTNNDNTYSIEISKGTTKLTFNASGGQIRFKSITIECEEIIESNVEYSNVDFRIGCGIDNAIESLADLPEGKEYTWGIEVSDGTNTKYYASSSEYLKKDTNSNINYVIISLGDVLNNISYAKIEFTVRAYVEVDGQKYYASEKAHSVESMLAVYSVDESLEDVEKASVNEVVQVLTNLGCYE